MTTTMKKDTTSTPVLFATLLVFLLFGQVAQAVPSIKTNLLSAFSRKKQYTPLLFFTVPAGLMAECDAVEQTVREVEKELGVRVARMDVLRNPANEAVLAVLAQQRTPPFLYHRESCQTISITPTATTSGNAKSKKKSMPVAVDKERIRAWAKGWYLTTTGSMDMGSAGKNAPPVVLQQEDTAMDQAELLEDMALTPEQLRGKRLMQERTEAKATAD